MSLSIPPVQKKNKTARTPSRVPFSASNFPSRIVEVGMVRADPEAAVRTRPPAAVNTAAVMGSGRKMGAAEVVSRRVEKVTANKPCRIKTSLDLYFIRHLCRLAALPLLFINSIIVSFSLYLSQSIICFIQEL